MEYLKLGENDWRAVSLVIPYQITKWAEGKRSLLAYLKSRGLILEASHTIAHVDTYRPQGILKYTICLS